MPYKYINNSASNMYDHNQVLSINTIMSISPIHSFIKEMLQCRERVKVPTIPGHRRFESIWSSSTGRYSHRKPTLPPSGQLGHHLCFLGNAGSCRPEHPRGTVARSLKSQQILGTMPGIPDAAGLAKLDLPTVYYFSPTR